MTHSQDTLFHLLHKRYSLREIIGISILTKHQRLRCSSLFHMFRAKNLTIISSTQIFIWYVMSTPGTSVRHVFANLCVSSRYVLHHFLASASDHSPESRLSWGKQIKIDFLEARRSLSSPHCCLYVRINSLITCFYFICIKEMKASADKYAICEIALRLYVT